MKGIESLILEQSEICRRQGAEFEATETDSMVGISRDAQVGLLPIHGLRHLPAENTSGWYIWSGNYSDAEDFFEPVHAGHIFSESPLIAPFLGLAPGWRFLLGENGYCDVWFDADLLVE